MMAYSQNSLCQVLAHEEQGSEAVWSTLQIHLPSVILRNIALHIVHSRQGSHFHQNTISLPPYSVQWIWDSANQSYSDIDIWCQAKTAIALHFQRRCTLCLKLHLLQGPDLHLMLSQGFSCRFYYTPGNPAQVTLPLSVRVTPTKSSKWRFRSTGAIFNNSAIN